MKLGIALILLQLIGLLPSMVSAQVGDKVFEDDFKTRDWIDSTQTTAWVNILAGEISLPYVSPAGGIAAGSDTVLVQNGNSVDFYDDQKSSYHYGGSYTAPNTLVLALRQNSRDHLRLNEQGSAVYMAYTGNGYVPVPDLALAGLESIVSMTWISDTRVLGLDMAHRMIRQFEMGESSFLELPSITLDIENPFQIVSKGADIAVLNTEGDISIYSYTDFVQASPALQLTGTGSTVITSDTDHRVLGITPTNLKEFQVSGNALNQSWVLNQPGADIQNVVSVSPGLVLLRDGSSITEFASTGSEWVATGRMLSGSGTSRTYLSPKSYVSKPILLPYALKGIQLIADEDRPAGTSIIYEVSINGGPWEPFTGVVRRATTFQTIQLKATLATTNKLTPRLKRVQIWDRSIVIDSFTVTAMVRNPGNLLPTTDPIDTMAGYRFDFEVLAPGADSIDVTFVGASNALGLQPVGPDLFAGNYYFDYQTEPGSIFDIHIYAKDSYAFEISKDLPRHVHIVNSILAAANVFTTK